MSSYTTSMFESIKTALNKNENTNTHIKDMLRLAVDKTYIVRLLPNTASPDKTFFHYYTFSWPSVVNGKPIIVTSPTSFGDRDPIAEERFRVYKHGTEAEKEAIKAVRRSENWLVNVYVVDDPVNPENNGKVKVIRYGRQIDKIVKAAIEGEDAEEFGPRVFDLSGAGTSLKIKVEKQGDFPSYVASKFQSPKEIPGLPATDFDKIYGSTFNLADFVQVKTYAEIEEIFKTHYRGEQAAGKPASASAPAAREASPIEDPEVAKLLAELNDASKAA